MTEAEQGLLFVEFLGAANVVFANYMTLVIEAVVWMPWLGTIIFFFTIRRQRGASTE